MPRSYGSVSLVDSLKQQQLSSADGEFHLWCAQEGLLTQRGPDLLNLQAASPLAANRPATCEPPRLGSVPGIFPSVSEQPVNNWREFGVVVAAIPLIASAISRSRETPCGRSNFKTRSRARPHRYDARRRYADWVDRVAVGSQEACGSEEFFLHTVRRGR